MESFWGVIAGVGLALLVTGAVIGFSFWHAIKRESNPKSSDTGTSGGDSADTTNYTGYHDCGDGSAGGDGGCD